MPLTESIAVSVKVGADVAVEVTLGMKDNDTAGEMRNALDDLIKQVKPLAALAGAAEPRAKPLADILEHRQDLLEGQGRDRLRQGHQRQHRQDDEARPGRGVISDQ